MSAASAATLNAITGDADPKEAPLDGTFDGVDGLTVKDLASADVKINWDEHIDDPLFDQQTSPQIIAFYRRARRKG